MKFNLQNIFRIVLGYVGRYRFSHINLIRTFFINICSFNLRTALKFPIFIYSNTKIYSLGTIEIIGEIKRGMIRIGHHPSKAIGPTKILGTGKYTFYGTASIWGGSILENHGHIIFGNKFSMAENCTILCQEKIEFGAVMSIGYRNTFMDSGFHYLLDNKKRITFATTIPIKIGGGSWITSDCKIMAGGCLPPNSILATNSVLKEDYSDQPQYQMYSGNPARCIRTNIRRIFNRKEESLLHKYFNNNKNKLHKKVNFQDEEDFCISNSFTFGQ